MKFFCIGDEETVLGFRLAGVQGRVAVNKIEAQEAFQVALSLNNIGIILLTADSAHYLHEEIQPYIYEKNYPLIVELPDVKNLHGKPKNVHDMLKDVIGINVERAHGA